MSACEDGPPARPCQDLRGPRRLRGRADAGDRRRHGRAEPAQPEPLTRTSELPTRSSLLPTRTSLLPTRISEPLSRAAGATEMIIAAWGRRPGRKTQLRAVAVALDRGERGNNHEGEGAGPSPCNDGLPNAATSAYHNMKQLHNVR